MIFDKIKEYVRLTTFQFCGFTLFCIGYTCSELSVESVEKVYTRCSYTCNKNSHVVRHLWQQERSSVHFSQKCKKCKQQERHVDHVVDLIVKQLTEVLKKKNKIGVAITPTQIKNHLWIFVNCLIDNPTFDSQTKENMILQSKKFGSKCAFGPKFTQNVTKIGIVDAILSTAQEKADKKLDKLGSKSKKARLKGISKLVDANQAGKARSFECTLILTEGDSAKAMVISGLSSAERDIYGVYLLRGKLLNVREANTDQLSKNAEITKLIRALGLQYGMKYETIADLKKLRYGKMMIMTDQDQDGSHIKGLIINFIHYKWPSLLKLNFIEKDGRRIGRRSVDRSNHRKGEDYDYECEGLGFGT